MVEIRRIGFATDFSDICQHAEGLVKTLRNRFNAELFIIHAFNNRELQALSAYYLMAGADKWLREREDEAKSLSKETVERVAEEFGNAHGVFLEGDPETAIIEFAETAELDLLVIGTHGHRGLDRLMLGSFAEHVLRAAPCPVLTVKLPKDTSKKAKS